MSAFVCILDRSGAPLDPRDVHRLTAPLAGSGQWSNLCRGCLAVAVRQGLEASDPGQDGPVVDTETGLMVAVVGRFSQVSVDSTREGPRNPQAAPSCASFALEAVLHGEDSFLARVAGSFVIIAADPQGRELSVARDHLGSLKVYYYLDHRWFIVASEPAAILRHPAVSDDLDAYSAARFLGFRFFQSDRSFFRLVKELPPAHRLRVTSDDSRVEQYWRFRRDRGGRDLSGDEVRAGFRNHLRRSLANEIAGLESADVALSLSGGMDSTALAALAPPEVRTFSWYFEDSPEGDERGNIQAVAEHLGRRIHWIKGDGLYPLCGEDFDRFIHENSPYINAFAGLKYRLYRAAVRDGCRRIMVGDSGDALYSAEEFWLRDKLMSGRRTAPASLIGTIRKAAGGDRFARKSLRRLLPISGIRRAFGRQPLPWLTDEALRCLPEHASSPILPEAGGRRRFDLIVGAKHTELESEEHRLFALSGIGRSNPFWYWPLLQMVIHLPAWWYHDDGRSKVLTQKAMEGLLPQSVLTSPRGGLLGSFFLRGIESKRDELRGTVFRRPRSDWQRYVKREWLEPYLDGAGSVEFGHTILWHVISYELWYRKLIGCK